MVERGRAWIWRGANALGQIRSKHQESAASQSKANRMLVNKLTDRILFDMITMPVSLSEALHKLASDGTILALLEIPECSIQLVRNIDDVIWNGVTWNKFWFELDIIEDATTGNVPELNIVTSNIGGFVESQVIANDNFNDCTCIIRLIDSSVLNETTPILEMTFDIIKVTVTRLAVTMKIGSVNPLMHKFPGWLLDGSVCQYKQFKGDLCGYSGSYTTCGRTLADCIQRANQARFGAQLGLKYESTD
jgi:phage-related protein